MACSRVNFTFTFYRHFPRGTDEKLHFSADILSRTVFKPRLTTVSYRLNQLFSAFYVPAFITFPEQTFGKMWLGILDKLLNMF